MNDIVFLDVDGLLSLGSHLKSCSTNLYDWYPATEKKNGVFRLEKKWLGW